MAWLASVVMAACSLVPSTDPGVLKPGMASSPLPAVFVAQQASTPIPGGSSASQRRTGAFPGGVVRFLPGDRASFERCVVTRESSGNAQIWNSSGHWGAFQFSYSTWVANGGAPSMFGHASFAEQEQVFLRSNPMNWIPFDHCHL